MKIDQRQLNRDIKKISDILEHTSKVLNKDKEKLIKQAGIFAVQSAVKLTEPGRTAKVSKLPKKFKFRPLVRIPDNFGFYYTSGNGKIFKKKTALTRSELRKGGIKRVYKGIKMWSNRRKGFTYVPYLGTKRDESDKRFKIPYAGAAKVGWLKSYQQLSKKSVDVGQNKAGKRYSRVTRSPGLLEIVNLVSYASKTSPEAARIGVRKARKRMEKIWLPRASKRIERNWRKKPSTYVGATV